ncbi:hypothetical protein NQ318_020858 [Aromia moschata]|uniref:THAP-type domain-containing protein n=1 Tax=Aromia moschata TaxID=1265417 RepID=A0AAV8XHY5_9CUCU|nr:hypothetical protein NQ318_020858 [Aromia moschata]
MNHCCCVPRCSSCIKRDPQLTFQIFSKQGKHQVSLINKFGQKERIDRRKAWILKLRIGKPVSKFMKVCSLHFAEKDYFYRQKLALFKYAKIQKRNGSGAGAVNDDLRRQRASERTARTAGQKYCLKRPLIYCLWAIKTLVIAVLIFKGEGVN